MDVFLECDIRGVYGSDIDVDFAWKLGRALAALARGERFIVAGDRRLHTLVLKASLVEGLVAGGADVADCGQIPTPVYYFAREALGLTAGAMVTASHNPPEYAGFKPILGPLPITPAEIRRIRKTIRSLPRASRRKGHVSHHRPLRGYRQHLGRLFAPRLPSDSGLRIVVDSGNGCFGPIAQSVLESFGFVVHPLFSRPDGRFPNRPSDVAKEAGRLPAMAAVAASGADFGVAYDGDGDRVAFVDNRGRSVPNDALIALLARHILQGAPGAKAVYDIKCSRVVPEAIRAVGCVPLAQRSGHTFIKTTMLQEDALFGGEVSGHLFYRELCGGDDALYSTLLMASVLIESGTDLATLVDRIPRYCTTPDIRLHVRGGRKAMVAAVRAHLVERSDCTLTEVDGVRAEFAEGWGLIRVSVTEPAVTLRFEAVEPEHLAGVIDRFLDPLPELRTRVFAQVEPGRPDARE